MHQVKPDSSAVIMSAVWNYFKLKEKKTQNKTAKCNLCICAFYISLNIKQYYTTESCFGILWVLCF